MFSLCEKLCGVKKIKVTTNEIETPDFMDDVIISSGITCEYQYSFDDIDDLLTFKKKGDVKMINIANMDIDDLTFVEKFVNLETLDATNNKIVNISPITRLKRLKNLNISYNPISDISPLSLCNSLEKIFLNDTSIESLHSLMSLNDLRVLDIGNTRITSINCLDELKNIEYICMPLLTKSKNLERKLHNTITFAYSGKSIMRYKIYFGLFYLTVDGIQFGKYKFI